MHNHIQIATHMLNVTFSMLHDLACAHRWNDECVCVYAVDYIRVYDWSKIIEHGVKSVGLIAGQHTPTIVSPNQYKMRFRLAMDRYFMVSPEHSSKLSVLAIANAPTNPPPETEKTDK
jgi:hypothetical protein